MPRSLARGDYRLILAIESASRADVWYRVLADRSTAALSCDCTAWIFNYDHRRCQHTEIASLLAQTPQAGVQRAAVNAASQTSPLIAAVQEQWPGLGGLWEIEEQQSRIGAHPYQFILVRLFPGNGGDPITGVAAFALMHQHPDAHLASRVAGWAGYAIAAEVARRGGFPLAGQLPEHFRVAQRGTSARQRGPQRVLPRSGLSDILRVGDQVNLGDGLRPTERAENTLRLFLGEMLYTQLAQQSFLDVSSARTPGCVYRLRRDPGHLRERRVRVFEGGRYTHDYCIVRGQDVPEADHYLTMFLQFLSDEQSALAVVRSHNIFGPNSDGPEPEHVPAVWAARPG